MSPSFIKRVALSCVIFVLASAGAAEAATYCVGQGCPAGSIWKPSIQSALNAASASAVADTVTIGPGVFKSATGLVYTSAAPGNDVTIVGSGPQTVLAPLDDVADVDFTTIKLTGPGASKLTNLSVKAARPAFDPIQGALSTTGGVELSGATMEHVGISKSIAIGPDSAGIPFGVRIAGSASMTKSSVQDAGTSIDTLAGSNAAITDSTLMGTVGVYARGRATVRRTHAITWGYGVKSRGGNVLVDNVLVQLIGAGCGVQVEAAGATSTLRASHLTVVKDGNGLFTAGGCAIVQHGDYPADLWVDNSILVPEHALSRAVGPQGNADANVTITHSSYDPATIDDDGDPGTLTQQSQFPAHLASFNHVAADDYHLKANSPLIDKGRSTPYVPSTLDLEENPRMVDGDGFHGAWPDLGAYERPAFGVIQP